MRCSVTLPSFRCATLCLIFSRLEGPKGLERLDGLPYPARPAPPTLPAPLLVRHRRLIDPHAEAQSHGVEDLLDLVQALATEILRLEHLGFGLLHQLANRADVRVLQTVVRTNREFELLDRLVEVLVADSAARLIAGGLALRFGGFFKVDEDVQVIANQLRGQRHRIPRAD